MSTGNNKKENKKELERFFDHQINLISDLFEGEEMLDKNLAENLSKTCQINILNKEWIEKWKKFVGYEQIKEKCKKINNSTHQGNSKDELYKFFIDNKTKNNLDDLGKMDFSIKEGTNIEKGNSILFKEHINFIPMIGLYCSYLKKDNQSITVSGSFNKGKIFLYNENNDKKIKEKKMLVLEKRKGNNNSDFDALMITLGQKESFKECINNIKDKTFEELINDKNLNAVKREISQNPSKENIKNKNDNKKELEKKELEDEKKNEEGKKNNKLENKKEAEDKKNKELLEEKKKKEAEDKKNKELLEEKKKKEAEDKKNKELLEEKKKKESEDKKNRELLEEKKKKEAEDKKNRELLEEKKKKEAEDKKNRELLEEKKKKEAEDKKNKELLEEKKKKEAELLEEKKKKELEEEKKKQEAEDKKNKELEKEKKKKELEKKKKKEEEEKMRKELEEKNKREEEEKKKKEEEEKKKKEEEEKKKKELEEQNKREEEEKKKKEEEKMRKELEEKMRKEFEEKKKKEEEEKNNIKKKDNIIKGIQENIIFEKEIAKNSSQKDKNFLSKCSIINKEWYKKLLEYSNFNIIKEQIKANEDIESTLKKNNDKINFNGIETLFQQNPNEIEVKPLDDIENLAFISTKFLENMNGFRKENGSNININGNDKEITIRNGQALLEINNQFCCFDLQEGNINKPKNKEIFDIPESLNKNEFLKEIKEDKEKINLRDIAKKKLTPRITIEKDVSLGLDNVGATCYMNATLQCLAHIKKISDHIVNYKRNKKFTDAKKYRLTKAYAEVVNGIWFPEEGKRSFAPNEFKKVIGEMNSLFAPTAANDAKDLLIFLIERMHNELNKTKETNLALIMPDNMDPTNQQQVFQCFAQEFTKKYNSVFSTYCYGSNTSMTLCHGCNIAKYSFQCFSFIIFPLLEAKNHRNYLISCGSLPQQLYNQPLNIEDCFNYYQKIEFFTGDNQMYCNYCRQLRNASMCTQIYYAPLVLILVLNRGRGNLDFREKFVFWETINLFNYVQFKMPDNTYFLSGIITHLGESGEGGHFIAFCRMSKDSKWYCYNDSIVNESNFNEINNKGTPYILFYQKIKME